MRSQVTKFPACFCLLGLLSAQVVHGEIVDVFIATGQSNATWPNDTYEFGQGVQAELTASGLFSNPVVVQTGAPGEAINTWYDTSAGVNYNTQFFDTTQVGTGLLEAQINTIIAAGDTPVFRGVFWFQGESDAANGTVAQYTDRWNGLLGQLDSDLAAAGLATDYNFVMNTVTNNWGDDINTTLATITNTDSSGILFDTQRLPYKPEPGGDWLHGYDHDLVGQANVELFNSAESATPAWHAGVNTTWDTTTANFLQDWAGSTYTNGDDVQFLGAGAGTVTLSGTITPGSVTVNSRGDYTFTGTSITGTGTLTKDGTGTLTLAGSSTSSYTGATVVNAGELILSANSARFHNSATTVENGAILSWNRASLNNTQAGRSILLKDGATLQKIVTGFSVLGVAGAGTTVDTGASVTINDTGAAGTLRGFFLDDGLKGSGTVTINAANAGNGVNFRNDNTTFAGTLIVNGIASDVAGAGSGIGVSGNTTGLQNADIQLNGTMELKHHDSGLSWANDTSLASTFQMGALSGSGVMVGNYHTAGGTALVTLGNTNNNGTFSGVIADGDNNVTSITKVGTGTQTFSGANTYSGTTTINGGTLYLDQGVGNPATAPQGTITINNGGTLAFGNYNQLTRDGAIADVVVNSGGVIDSSATVTTFDNITLNGGTMQANGGFSPEWGAFVVLDKITVTADSLIQNASGANNYLSPGAFNGARTLTFDVSGGATLTNELGMVDYNGTRTYTIVKDGAGTAVFSGASSYTGATTVNAGRLVVNGTHTGGGTMTININGTLAGSGSITGDIDVFGAISPGNSPGTLTQFGDQTWFDGGSYEWEINDAGGTKGADPGWDWIDINGTLDLTNLTAGQFDIDITSLTTANDPGMAAGFSWAGLAYGDPFGTTFIITTADTITGFEATDFLLDDSAFVNGKLEWSISLLDDTRDSLVLSAIFVPEPSSSALLGLGALALMLRRKRS